MRNDNLTIFALSSAPGRAGLAVIRISGAEAISAAETLAGAPLPTRRASLRTLRDPGSGDALDHALVLTFASPASFTGEDVAELHIHGGTAVVAGVLEALARIAGLRLAEPGEFSRRAFENARLDLTEAEGLADLIAAETEAQRRQALAQMRGALADLYAGWRDRLLEAEALMAASLDFADEADVPGGSGELESRIHDLADDLAREIAAHLNDQNRGEILRDGFRVVLAGPTNAGKSSLLNALARRDVAITSPEPGTTRDVIEARLNIAGLPIIIADTAGLRATTVAIESEGMRRALAESRSADLVLWLSDNTKPTLPPSDLQSGSQGRTITVATKSDLRPSPAPPDMADLEISALTGAGLPELIALIGEAAKTRTGPCEQAPLTRQRHRAHLEECLAEISHYLETRHPYPELAAEDLRRARDALGRVTGHVKTEDVLDRIFADFCIGK